MRSDALLAAVAALGALLGVANALLLRRSVRRLVAGPPSIAALAFGALIRNLLTLAPIFVAAGERVDTLIAGLAAFVVARLVAVRRVAAPPVAAKAGAPR